MGFLVGRKARNVSGIATPSERKEFVTVMELFGTCSLMPWVNPDQLQSHEPIPVLSCVKQRGAVASELREHLS